MKIYSLVVYCILILLLEISANGIINGHIRTMYYKVNTNLRIINLFVITLIVQEARRIVE